jgi:hypothetical protein
MNIHEGARRMKRAGQWMIMIPLTVVLIIWAVALAASVALHREELYHPALLFIIAFVYLAIPGGVLWLAGWIVEGFAKDPD